MSHATDLSGGTGVIPDRERAKDIAKRLGYFWLPCSVCGEHFAGFEWGESLRESWSTGHGTCARFACREETKRRNLAWMDANPDPSIDSNRLAYERERNAPASEVRHD